jgi:hypothetical protein
MMHVMFKIFLIFLNHRLIPSSVRALPVSYPVGTKALSVGVTQLGHETDHLVPSNAEVKNSLAIPPIPNTSA